MKVFLAVALVGLLAANTQAAVIEVQPVVAGYFDTAFNPVPDPYSASPLVIQVDVMMEVLSLAPGEDGFGYAAFNFGMYSYPGTGTLGPDPDAGGWYGNYEIVDSNGPAPGGLVTIFATNFDGGVDSQDLQGILVYMAGGPFTNSFDPRRNVGEPGSPLGVPIWLGSAFLEWRPGCGGAIISLKQLQVGAKLTTGQFVPAVGVTSPARIGFFCSEPTSAVLLGSCLMGIVLSRRVGFSAFVFCK